MHVEHKSIINVFPSVGIVIGRLWGPYYLEGYHVKNQTLPVLCTSAIYPSNWIGLASTSFLAFMQLSMLCPRGGGGPRDRVGTLNVRVRPTWGILTNFDHRCWPRDREF